MVVKGIASETFKIDQRRTWEVKSERRPLIDATLRVFGEEGFKKKWCCSCMYEISVDMQLEEVLRSQRKEKGLLDGLSGNVVG